MSPAELDELIEDPKESLAAELIMEVITLAKAGKTYGKKLKPLKKALDDAPRMKSLVSEWQNRQLKNR